MALSQNLDESPLRPGPGRTHEPNPQEVYSERHRLALEELLSGGRAAFSAFLRRERLPSFLSERELQRIERAAVPAPCAWLPGDELDQSARSSLDCSSVTYFPEVSDLEPPPLELGWPAFTAGSYRGVTRAHAHFQPSYGGSIYSCKEAARRMIRSAREVIALVTDALTDPDILLDLQQAAALRGVPVYVLLDRGSAPAFLSMCRELGVWPDDLQLMRVRTVAGSTYYTRSGARITGDVHERFMLVDGNRVATGSYRFNWTDGKLNSSTLLELSGQLAETFDLRFRVLYAQSQALPPGGPTAEAPPPGGPTAEAEAPPPGGPTAEAPPPRGPTAGAPPPGGPTAEAPPPRGPRAEAPPTAEAPPPRGPTAEALPPQGPTAEAPPSASPCWAGRRPTELLTSTPKQKPPPAAPHLGGGEPRPLSDSWAEREEVLEEVLASCTARPPPVCCHASTQTGRSVTDGHAQTDQEHRSGLEAALVQAPPPDPSLQDCFQKLSRERRHHYAVIRSKLEHVVAGLARRRDLGDVTSAARGLAGRRGAGPESPGTGTWPRARH